MITAQAFSWASYEMPVSAEPFPCEKESVVYSFWKELASSWEAAGFMGSDSHLEWRWLVEICAWTCCSEHPETKFLRAFSLFILTLSQGGGCVLSLGNLFSAWKAFFPSLQSAVSMSDCFLSLSHHDLLSWFSVFMPPLWAFRSCHEVPVHSEQPSFSPLSLHCTDWRPCTKGASGCYLSWPETK